ncbi:DUF6387 family protein [Methylobacter svalbardensis]|uniref:DUF6387 family protein n=1 Tax=Methylobacter svalbardensis TaxID=3080016 RepID=UPI0030EE9A93
MADDLDTSWFDLKNYEELKIKSFEDWAILLNDRWIFYKTVEKYENYVLPNNIVDGNLLVFLDNAVACLKEGFSSIFIDDKPKFPRSSVCDLTLYEVWDMAQDERLIHIQPDRCKDEFVETIAFESYGIDNWERKTRVTINLSATDEQIKNDFNRWLIDCRQVTGIESQKKLFTQDDFDYWIRYGVIPYLDLLLIAKIERKKITQNKLAKLIFPDEYNVDIVGRLRQVTKPEAERLISQEIHRALQSQLDYEKIGMKNIQYYPGT